MFTINTLVDHTVATTKQAFAYIPNQEIRTGLETLVDAQAEFTKTMFGIATDMGKSFYDAALATFPKQPAVAKK